MWDAQGPGLHSAQSSMWQGLREKEDSFWRGLLVMTGLYMALSDRIVDGVAAFSKRQTELVCSKEAPGVRARRRY